MSAIWGRIGSKSAYGTISLNSKLILVSNSWKKSFLDHTEARPDQPDQSRVEEGHFSLLEYMKSGTKSEVLKNILGLEDCRLRVQGLSLIGETSY